jgi:hypothetical protein
MYRLPSHFRHIDWATYGLYCLKTLADETPPDDPAFYDLFTTLSTYRVYRSGDNSCSQIISQALLLEQLTTLDKWHLHKNVSTGIRLAYLADLEVIQIRLVPVRTGGDTFKACYELSDGSVFTLQKVAKSLAHSVELVTQTGDPNIWYNPSAWTGVNPPNDEQQFSKIRQGIALLPLSPSKHSALNLSSYESFVRASEL